jgi:HupE / UreJ protein
MSGHRRGRGAPRWLGPVAALLLGALAPRPAAAHPLDLGYLRLTLDDDVLTARLELEVGAAERALGVAVERLDAAALQQRAAALADATLRSSAPSAPTGPCRWRDDALATRAGRTIGVRARADCPAGALRWQLPFVAERRISPTFQLLVKGQAGGASLVATLDGNRAELELRGAPTLRVTDFVVSGVEHIGAAPNQWRDDGGLRLPDGLDHILFLLALLLAGGSLPQRLGVTTGFTIGHSVTLALAVLTPVRPPPALIEPLIALSIAIVAAEVYLGKATAPRWKIAAFFGLVHGFGFAGALTELALAGDQLATALVGYNLGVELGQLVIVLLATPLLLALRVHPRLERAVTRGVAAAICGAGLFWFLTRTLQSL